MPKFNLNLPQMPGMPKVPLPNVSGPGGAGKAVNKVAVTGSSGLVKPRPEFNLWGRPHAAGAQSCHSAWQVGTALCSYLEAKGLDVVPVDPPPPDISSSIVSRYLNCANAEADSARGGGKVGFDAGIALGRGRGGAPCR